MTSQKLSPRLLAAADYVRQMSFIADVGTDHAYLPIYLCSQGKISGAVASDINEGPVARAKINVGAAHLSRKISVKRCDGLSGIEEYSPDDILICGMGGELICSIIDGASWTRRQGIRLILQPMTHAEKLREYLLSEGFSIVGESLAREEKIYQILCAEYTGRVQRYSPLELIFGRLNIETRPPEIAEYARYVLSVYEAKRDGKRSASLPCDEEEKMILEIEALISSL